MSEKHSTDKLVGVPRTMLIPLLARATETRKPDGIIRDPYAVDMLARIDYDFSEMSHDLAGLLGIAIRTEILDELTQAYIDQHPHACIINLGAGLDARFYRLDNAQIRWIDLDLPESLDLRRKFFSETDRLTFLEKSVLDFSWMDALPADKDLLFIAEGLLIYFDEADVKNVLTTLAERFPGAEMLVEVIGQTMAQKSHRHHAVTSTNTSFRWGIRHAEKLAEWHENIQYVSDISIYDRHEARWLELPLNWVASLQDLRNTVDRIVHLRFA